MRLFVFLFLLAKIARLNVASAAAPAAAPAATTHLDSITCEMEATDNTFGSEASFEASEDDDDEWNCVDESDTLYDLDGEWTHIFDDYNVKSGVTTFTFRGVDIIPELDLIYGLPTIYVYNNSEIELVHTNEDEDEDEDRRKLAVPTSGELEVMVVRVTDSSGEQPSLNGTDIANRIFGTVGDMSSLKSQMGECSGDQLTLTASTRTADLLDGVLELPIEVNVADFSDAERKYMEKVVNNKLKLLGYNVRSCKF